MISVSFQLKHIVTELEPHGVYYLSLVTLFFFIQDFHFHQLKKTRVFEPPDDLPKERSCLLALSNKFGLTFVGLDRTLKVYLTQDILAADKYEGNSNDIGINLFF